MKNMGYLYGLYYKLIYICDMFTKKAIFTLLIILFFAGGINAQSKKFLKVMKKNIAMLDSAKNEKELTTCVKNFKKVKEQDNWLVNYYIAFSYLRACFDEKQENVEELCDTAEIFLKKADSLSKENSEIYVLRSMLATGRIIADPNNRWMQYGKRSYDALAKAMSLDASNPRPYVIKGQSAYYTPGSMGGCEKALSHMNTAKEKFKTFKPQSEIHPYWGKTIIEEITKECNKAGK
jgi:hypothetical protein